MSVNVVVAQPEVPSEQTIVLELLEGWDKLDAQQHKYLHEYAQDPNRKTFCAMKLGYPISMINKWFQQESFSKVANQIFDLYTEDLKAIDYLQAKDSQKIRGRVIQARENGGRYSKESKPTQHNHLHLPNEFNLSDLLKN